MWYTNRQSYHTHRKLTHSNVGLYWLYWDKCTYRGEFDFFENPIPSLELEIKISVNWQLLVIHYQMTSNDGYVERINPASDKHADIGQQNRNWRYLRFSTIPMVESDFLSLGTYTSPIDNEYTQTTLARCECSVRSCSCMFVQVYNSSATVEEYENFDNRSILNQSSFDSTEIWNSIFLRKQSNASK